MKLNKYTSQNTTQKTKNSTPNKLSIDIDLINMPQLFRNKSSEEGLQISQLNRELKEYRDQILNLQEEITKLEQKSMDSF